MEKIEKNRGNFFGSKLITGNNPTLPTTNRRKKGGRYKALTFDKKIYVEKKKCKRL